jgi:chemotaxis protein MotB
MRRMKSNNLITDDTNRWIVSYADFVTLLFAFFVVMYAVSSVNMVKYKTLAEGLGQAFSKDANKKINPNASKQKKTDAHYVSGNIHKELNKLEKALKEVKGSEMELYTHKGWIELDIKANALFMSASAEINPNAIGKIKKIAELVKGKGYSVALEGYTDNIPIRTNKFPSNWELSASRAAAVARVLVSEGVSPSLLSATGYGEQYPIASNNTETGRAKNRRVVVIIAKDKSVGRFLNPKLAAKAVRGKDTEIGKIKKDKLIPVVKEIRTETGGIKFIRTFEKKSDLRRKSVIEPAFDKN